MDYYFFFDYFYVSKQAKMTEKNLNLKRDQLPPKQAENWASNMEFEKKLSFNLHVPSITLNKETYKILSGENENRIRIYLGLEPKKMNDKYILCAYAVPTFLMGSGEVFRDYENPVFKLDSKSQDKPVQSSEAIKNIKLYQKWRNGELDEKSEWTDIRKYIYPKAFLIGKYELHEIFNVQNKNELQICFGISKTMNVLIYPEVKETRKINEQRLVFDFTDPCPPDCDRSSIFF